MATAFAFRLGAHYAFRLFVDELERAGVVGPRAEVAAAVLWHFVLGYVTDEQQHEQAAALGAIASAPDDVTSISEDRFAQAIKLIVAGARSSVRNGERRRDTPRRPALG